MTSTQISLAGSVVRLAERAPVRSLKSRIAAASAAGASTVPWTESTRLGTLRNRARETWPKRLRVSEAPLVEASGMPPYSSR